MLLSSSVCLYSYKKYYFHLLVLRVSVVAYVCYEGAVIRRFVTRKAHHLNIGWLNGCCIRLDDSGKLESYSCNSTGFCSGYLPAIIFYSAMLVVL